ncbi:hypothetical protein [Priestia flexa]|uniref:hypothetical protein n=1 Tax=Priestia flexa TaxID=86664 RepID=UPI0032EF54C9
MVTNSFSMGSKIVITVNNSDLASLGKESLQTFLDSELPKYKQGFSEVIFMNSNKQNRSFYLQ